MHVTRTPLGMEQSDVLDDVLHSGAARVESDVLFWTLHPQRGAEELGLQAHRVLAVNMAVLHAARWAWRPSAIVLPRLSYLWC